MFFQTNILVHQKCQRTQWRRCGNGDGRVFCGVLLFSGVFALDAVWKMHSPQIDLLNFHGRLGHTEKVSGKKNNVVRKKEDIKNVVRKKEDIF